MGLFRAKIGRKLGVGEEIGANWISGFRGGKGHQQLPKKDPSPLEIAKKKIRCIILSRPSFFIPKKGEGERSDAKWIFCPSSDQGK